MQCRVPIHFLEKSEQRDDTLCHGGEKMIHSEDQDTSNEDTMTFQSFGHVCQNKHDIMGVLVG